MGCDTNTEIEKSQPGMGWLDEFILFKPTDFVTLAGATLAAATTGIGIAQDNSASWMLHMGGAVDQTSGFEASITVPGNFFRGEFGRRPQVRVGLTMRKVDLTGSATENADLSVKAELFVQALADASLTSVGSTTTVLPAKTALAAAGSMLSYSADLLASTSAANLAKIVPGSLLVLRITVNEAIGTNLVVRIRNVRLQFLRDIKVQDNYRI
jgi:hypothetical protein